MTIDGLKKCWELILQKDITEFKDYRFPLVNLRGCESYFGFQSLPLHKFTLENDFNIASEKPTFKNLTENKILTLRKYVYEEERNDSLDFWAEKLMRFCELYLPSLKKKALEKWKDKTSARLQMLLLSTFLLDYSFYSKDLRFLNTVLKLSDFDWIVSEKTVERRLKNSDVTFVCALLEFRVRLMTHCAVSKLSKGEEL